jgi:hypothetical protein
VEAVTCQLVSIGGFPANREKYREDCHVTGPIHSEI